jgi:hypothetical protein
MAKLLATLLLICAALGSAMPTTTATTTTATMSKVTSKKVKSSMRSWEAKHNRGGAVNARRVELLAQGALPPDLWLTQTLDHFDHGNEQQWVVRYLIIVIISVSLCKLCVHLYIAFLIDFQRFNFHIFLLARWQQRYFVNDTFWKPNGPVFIQIGGEGAANAVWVVEGSMVDYAQRVGALILQLEHRFYGKSHPTEDTSVESLKFLTSQQGRLYARVRMISFFCRSNARTSPLQSL